MACLFEEEEESQLISRNSYNLKNLYNALLSMSFAGKYFRIRSSIDSFSVACEAFSEKSQL